MVSGQNRLVILGTGWGSYSILRNLKRKLYDVIVVSPRNHFLFTPLLTSTTVGTLEFRSIIEPIRNAGFRHSEDFHLARAVSLDMQKRIIRCQSAVKPENEYDITYNKLVIGVGALPNTFHTKGVTEYAYFLKELADARKIRNRLLSNFELSMEPGVSNGERKRLLRTVIVGGGPTGVEFGAELYDFVEQDVARLYGHYKSDIRVTLVEPAQILSSFDARLRGYAEKKILQRSNFVLVKSSVKEVTPDGVTLADGSHIPCGLVVWSTGLSPQPFTAGLTTMKKNKAGQIVVDDYLRVISDESGSCYALGDCASILDTQMPATAQVAERQGRYLANALNSVGENASATVKPFTFSSMGMLAYIGGYRGVSDLKEVKIKGIASWLVWRSAYLTRLGSWRLRMQVPLDWLKTFLFGRDTSRFD